MSAISDRLTHRQQNRKLLLGGSSDCLKIQVLADHAIKVKIGVGLIEKYPCIDDDKNLVKYFHEILTRRDLIVSLIRWKKLCEGKKGLRRKVWTQGKILGPNLRYFIAILRFVAFYALLGNLWAKKCFFGGQKQCFLSEKCTTTWYILHIILG